MVTIVVQSSAIRAIDYDEKTRELEIFFTDGDYARYLNVPKEVYDKFMEAPSTGKFFNTQIRDVYPLVK